MKKFLISLLAVFALVLSVKTVCLAVDTFYGEDPLDYSELIEDPDFSGAAGSVADIVNSIKTDPSNTENYQTLANLCAKEKFNGYKVLVEGSLLDFTKYDNVQPTMVNGRVLVPIRAISEALGADVKWDSAAKTVIITQGAKVIKLTVNSNYAYIDGAKTTLDVSAKIINGRTLVPIRFVGTAFGEQVGWYSSGSAGIVALFT